MSMRRILRSLLGTPLKWLNIESDQRMSDTLQLVVNLSLLNTVGKESVPLRGSGWVRSFSLCNLRGSLWLCGVNDPKLLHHRDTENTEDAQRKAAHPPATARWY